MNKPRSKAFLVATRNRTHKNRKAYDRKRDKSSQRREG